jgi:hypothetical protein
MALTFVLSTLCCFLLLCEALCLLTLHLSLLGGREVRQHCRVVLLDS